MACVGTMRNYMQLKCFTVSSSETILSLSVQRIILFQDKLCPQSLGLALLTLALEYVLSITLLYLLNFFMGFLGGSDGKESTDFLICRIYMLG